MTGCEWHVNPFADDDGRCGQKPTIEETFRRKADGHVKIGRRCQEHRSMCNDNWELVPS